MNTAITTKPDTWGVVPVEMNLRAALPKLSADTRVRVCEWAGRQEWAREWWQQRTREYWEGFQQHPDADLERLVTATAALDLLEHVCQCRSGQAVQWLKDMDEVAAAMGGVINVTREEFADIRRIMRGEPGCDVPEAKAVCQRLGLELDAMAFRRWTVKVVDEVKQRCEPPNTK